MTTLEIVFWCFAIYWLMGIYFRINDIHRRLKEALLTPQEKMDAQFEAEEREYRYQQKRKAEKEASDKLFYGELDAMIAERDEKDRKASGQ